MPKQQRCHWCGDDPVYQAYHDREWGVPLANDRELFEFLILEGAQAGLSWITVLKKRARYRQLFANFEIQQVAALSDQQLETILLDPGIIRNRLKVYAARSNARAALQVAAEFGSFTDYIWHFSNRQPIQNCWDDQSQLPSRSELSDAMAKDMKKRGFKFVGSTIIYAYMQAIGMVNDHIRGCFRHRECARLRLDSTAFSQDSGR